MLARLPSHRHGGQPFAITADPRVVFESTAFRSAFLALTNAIAMQAGLILLVGDAGCGKTVLLRTLREAHARGGRPTFLRHATATGDLLAGLLAELHLDAIPSDRNGRLQALAECLAQRPGPALLLIDEGDELSNHQLAELAALAGWRRGELDNLQIVVAGRPELKERIEQRTLAAAAPPSVATTRLGPLLRQEINHYVARHLALGRRRRVSFGSMALDRLYTHSEGLPLKVNLLCTCILSRKSRSIEAADVDAVAYFCGLIPAPAKDAVGTAAPAPRRAPGRRVSAMRRTGGRVLRFGYRSVGFIGLAALAFAIIHLVQSVGDVVRRDEGVQLVLDSQLQTGETERAEPAPRAYIAAAVKTLADPGALLAPAILARPLASRGTELAQGAVETAPAAATPEPQPDDADTPALEQAIKAVNEADEMAAAAAAARDEHPVPESQPSDPQPAAAGTEAAPDAPAQPVITHLWPGGDNETPSGAAEAPPTESVEQPAREAAAPAAPAPIEAPPPAAAAAPARDPLSGAAAPSLASPSARAEALDTERLMRRGHALLQEGDVASARLFFERAAATGHAAALTALGQSFDPLELQRLGVIGIKADARRALEWYRAANAAGDAAAQERGARLSGWVERGQPAR